MPKDQLTPVAWQKFGDDYCLTGQFGMRPIFLSAQFPPPMRIAKGKPGLRLLNMENMLLVPFTPDHPHAQRIVDGWNNIDRWQGERAGMLATLKLIQRGLSHGSITSKPLITIDPDAEFLGPPQSLLEIVTNQISLCEHDPNSCSAPASADQKA